MTRFELYYGGTDVDVDVVSATRCPMPHHVNMVHELKDADKSCLARHDCSPVGACKICWTKKLNENDLPEVTYILAHRYSDLGLKMMDFVFIGVIMLNKDCTFEEALYKYHKRLDACIGKE